MVESSEATFEAKLKLNSDEMKYETKNFNCLARNSPLILSKKRGQRPCPNFNIIITPSLNDRFRKERLDKRSR